MANIVFQNTDEMDQAWSTLPAVIHPHEQTWGEKFHNTEKKTNQQLAELSAKPIRNSEDVEKFVSTLRKAPKGTTDNAQTMLKMIEKHPSAYAACSQKLQNNDEFNREAIKTSTSTYDLMAPEKQRDPNLAKIYTAQMISHSRSRKVNGYDAMLPQCPVNPNLPINQNQYKEDYEKVFKDVISGTKTIDAIRTSEEYQRMMLVRQAAKNNPEAQATIEQTERAVAENNWQAVQNKLENNRMTPTMEIMYDEMQHQHPALKQKMDAAQEEYWRDSKRMAQVYHAEKRLHNAAKQSKTLNNFRRDEQQLEADKQTIEEAKKRIKSTSYEDALAAYIKQSAKEQIQAAQDRGEIGDDMASMYIGMIDCLHSTTLIRATVNDYDNVNELTPQEQSDLQEMANKYHSTVEGNIEMIYSIAKQATEEKSQAQDPVQEPEQESQTYNFNKECYQSRVLTQDIRERRMK